MVEDSVDVSTASEALAATLQQCTVTSATPQIWLGAQEVCARDAGVGARAGLPEPGRYATDYKAAIVRTRDTTERLALAPKLVMHRVARGVLPEVDACFAALELETAA
jgi:uroporphyrinogen-III decarboxylase